jgi:transcription termination/antitermination protein NusG
MRTETAPIILENRSQPLWFALAVKPRHEQSVGRSLRERKVEEFVPVYREQRVWSDRAKRVELPLFPGYVFSRFAYHERLIVLNTPGVVAILGAGKVFTPVSDEQIAMLRAIVSSGLPARPCPYLAPGQLVHVDRGPLSGIRGTVVRGHGSTAIVVSIEMLQRSVAVELSHDSVHAISPPEPEKFSAIYGAHSAYAKQ